MNLFHNYLVNTCITFLFLWVLTAVFNAFIDPFELFNSPLIEHINQQKPQYYSHDRMIKASRVRSWKPDVLVMGSSRAEFGLNPDNPDLLKTATPAFNLGISSANIYEILCYLKHAHQITPLKQVVIGLDLFMFNVYKPNQPDFNENRLAPHITGWYWDLFQALLTYDGIKASIKTLDQQSKIPDAVYFPNGFRDHTYSWSQIQETGGHHRAAIDNESYTLSKLDGYVFFSITNDNKSSNPLDTFKQILTFCQVNHIDLHLFISPEHARKLVLIHKLGLWPEFELWKRNLVTLITENTPEFSLWDFSGFNSITTESFPPIGDNQTQMHWYWESSHYKKEVGNMILHKLLTNDTGNYPSDFGVQLNPMTIEPLLQQIKVQRDNYIKSNPEIMTEIQTMVTNTATTREQLLKQYPHLKPIAYFQDRVTSK